MHWIILILAGIFECSFTFCLGKANIAAGKAQILWYAAFVMFYILSMVFLAKAIKVIPIGTAYPIWTGIGAVGTVLIGILYSRSLSPCGECFSSSLSSPLS